MKLCVKYRLNSTPEQEAYLRKLAFYATKLYNTDNWMRREQWDKTGKIPSWYDQKKTLKYNHWYRLLPSQTAQAVIKNLQDNYVSWFRLRKSDNKARAPKFRRKDRLSPLSFYQQFSISEGKLNFSMSRKFRKETGIDKLTFEINMWRDIKGIPKMCNILYQNGKWMAHIVYEVDEKPLKEYPNIMAVDVGIINLLTVVDTNGQSKIYSGNPALFQQGDS